MIEVHETFEVAATPDRVWQVLADAYEVVRCVPGAAIVGQDPDGALDTTISVKFGPLSVGFQAKASLELDPAARRGQITARGRDKQGGARFQARATFGVEPDATGGGSVVATHGEVDISGRLASLIEGGAGVVVKRMAADFAGCLQARCAL
jgi:carbon monoxide dehydrogenase subunit G